MVNAVALPALDRDAARSVASRWYERVSPLVALAPAAILLGILRVWSLGLAPRYGVYFTAEAFLIIYACLAIVRAVHVDTHSHDASQRYAPQLAQQAKREFYAGLQRHLVGIALFVLPLLLVALLADVLTAGTGIQRRPNVHLSMMFVELMAWWRYGSALVVASARWTPSRPPAFARARALVRWPGLDVTWSLAPAHIALSVAALSGLAVYGGRAGAWMLGSAIDPRVVLGCSAALCAGFAWLALWRMCRGSLAVLARVRDRAAARATSAIRPRRS
jgi:hypothetical protein